MNRTEFIGTNLYYSQEFIDDMKTDYEEEIERLKTHLDFIEEQNIIIEKLEKENEKLKEQNKMTDEQIEKAIKFINEELLPYGNEWHWDTGGIEDYVLDLLNILGGDE